MENNQMTDYSGYWVGHFGGTSVGGFNLVLRQDGTRITGNGTFNEPAIGLYEYSVVGDVGENLTINLTPTNGMSIVRLGQVKAECTLKSNGTLFGKWQSQNGTLGTFTARREAEPTDGTPSNSIFIVHGHDEATKEKVARFLEKLGLIAVILHEQVSQGKTLIEKFESYAAKAGFAIILITPDDYGYPVADESKKAFRARQNVILELGYFAGKLGREKSFVLCKTEVELPSDILGLVFHRLDSSDGWKMQLAKELKAAGYQIDPSKVL
jgi:predicted nucleotide-binding protein